MLYKILYLIFILELILVNFQAFKMEFQVGRNGHFQHHLLFAFNRGAKAIELALEIFEVYDQEAMYLRMVKN